MNTPYDRLWHPDEPGDEQLREFERTLAPFAAHRRLSLAEAPRVRPPRRWRSIAWTFAAAASLMLAIIALYQYRLVWPDNQAWAVQWQSTQAAARLRTLTPGQLIATAADETASLGVARIGKLDLAPNTTLRLLETRTGHHRVMLESGELHARIWAPPGQFSIDGQGMQTIDLGCEFILRRDHAGHGRLTVMSGWVLQAIDTRDVLVPAGHAVDFDLDGIGTPLRVDAPLTLTQAVLALDQALRRNGATAIDAAAQRVVDAASDEDRYTLLSLLLRHPQLSQGPLYPRLAQALGTRADDSAHRARMAAADPAAIDAWWRLLPTQPKRWWANWRDAF